MTTTGKRSKWTTAWSTSAKNELDPARMGLRGAQAKAASKDRARQVKVTLARTSIEKDKTE